MLPRRLLSTLETDDAHGDQHRLERIHVQAHEADRGHYLEPPGRGELGHDGHHLEPLARSHQRPAMHRGRVHSLGAGFTRGVRRVMGLFASNTPGS